MRVSILKYSAVAGIVFLAACSTKKNTFISRNSHALSTKYNILYNGDLALQTGLNDLKTNYADNFWERLPIERMQVDVEELKPGESQNPNFERAETKAAKAIQKHSMNIGGSEKNPQIDEAHLMLGKARYYDQRFVPALEAFNYILYKYPSSDKIYEAKIWREKTNMRLENDAIAVSNLRKLLSEIKFKDQIYADANAALAQAFLNLEQKDSAVARLKRARDFTKDNEEKARYRFILGQLYEEMGQPDSAFAAFQEVIDMNRKSPRQYVIHAHGHQSMQFDYASGDTITFLKKYEKLLEDRENRPYLDALNHQLGLFYDHQNNDRMATRYYNASLKHKTQNAYMVASNYRNIADINFDNAKYAVAGKYYDSTMVNLDPRSREFKQIKRKRDNLEDVIKYEAIATANDSIISLASMNGAQRTAYFEEYIEKLKKQDKERQILEEKAAREQLENPGMADATNRAQGQRERGVSPALGSADAAADKREAFRNQAASSSGRGQAGPGSTFYFYNPATVAYGKNEFRRIWGERPYRNNWRSATGRNAATPTDQAATDEPQSADEPTTSETPEVADQRYDVNYYISQIPTSATVLDSIFKERNFAYYQLGIIYKEKFREYQLSIEKLEELLASSPEERLILPSMYHLYKVYEITGNPKAATMRSRIISEYPESRYAQILSDSGSESAVAMSPEDAYNELYRRYMDGDYHHVLAASEEAIDQYTGDEIVSKFELLKAHVIGKFRGVEEYKTALNFVALNYPNSEEGKKAEELLGTDIPKLESLDFSDEKPSGGWKILYRAKSPEEKNTKALQAKINKFMDGREFDKIRTSFDIYTETDNFIVIHGFNSRDAAEDIVTILRDHKDYKVADRAIVISSWNYQIVQMRKNLDEFLGAPRQPKPTSAGDNPQPAPQSSKVNDMPAERAQPMKGRVGNPVESDDVQPIQPMRGREGNPGTNQPVQNPPANPGQPGFQNVNPSRPNQPGTSQPTVPSQQPNQNPGQSVPGQNVNPNPSQPQPGYQVGGPPPAPQIQSTGK